MHLNNRHTEYKQQAKQNLLQSVATNFLEQNSSMQLLPIRQRSDRSADLRLSSYFPEERVELPATASGMLQLSNSRLSHAVKEYYGSTVKWNQTKKKKSLNRSQCAQVFKKKRRERRQAQAVPGDSISAVHGHSSGLQKLSDH